MLHVCLPPCECVRRSLVSTDTLRSSAWLAVRHTAWSSRILPHLRNTRRTVARDGTRMAGLAAIDKAMKRRTDPEGTRLPIKLDATSNGELAPAKAAGVKWE